MVPLCLFLYNHDNQVSCLCISFMHLYNFYIPHLIAMIAKVWLCLSMPVANYVFGKFYIGICATGYVAGCLTVTTCLGYLCFKVILKNFTRASNQTEQGFFLIFWHDSCDKQTRGSCYVCTQTWHMMSQPMIIMCHRAVNKT